MRPSRSATALIILLRLMGGSMILAIFAVVMPDAWLRAAVAEVAPNTPVNVLLEYLSRGLSAFYFLLGGLIWLFSTDLPRYAPAGRFVSLCYIVITGSATTFLVWLSATTPDWEKPWFFWMVLFNLASGFAFGLPIFLLYRQLIPRWTRDDREMERAIQN